MKFDPKLYDKLSAYCAYSERCTKDVLEKCKKLNIANDEISDYILRLENQGFLSENRYAKSFIESKINRKWGFSKIQSALQLKGVSTEIFAPFLEAVETEVLIENIKVLAERKIKTLKANTENERKQKLVRFLMSKGYSYELIKKAMSN